MKALPMREVYMGLLRELMERGFEEVNARTNTRIKMPLGGTSFKLDLTNGKLPIAGNRKYFPHVAAAETAWQFMGTRSPDFILEHAPKLWSKFLEPSDRNQENVDAGRALPNQILKTAYGWRWREAFGRDQLQLAVDQLRDNPTNRQLFISAWDPRSDGLGGPQPKNIPCPLGFTLSRFGDAIHMSVFVRSSDVFVGLPYDVMAYAFTLDAIAASVGCAPGTIHFSLAHPHLYEPHWNAATACTKGFDAVSDLHHTERSLLKGASTNWAGNCQPNLPGWTIEDILANPDGYVKNVKTLSSRVNNNPWNPMPEVIE